MRLTLSAPQRPWGDEFVDYRVHLSGGGVDAVTSVTSIEGDSLDAFLRDTADHFRGWTGARSWRSFEGQLRIDAVWGTRGHVTLRVFLCPDAYEELWSVSSAFDVEAGAEMQTLAAAVAAFFSDAI